MKRILGLLLSLTLCMTLLCGCQVQKGNYLRPVKLTESERELLTLTNPNLPILLDYHVEGAKSMAIEKMILKDGTWVKEEDSLFAMETDDVSKPMEGRMALNYSTKSNSFGLTSAAVLETAGSLARTAELSNHSDYEMRSAATNQNETIVTLNEPVYLLLFCADKLDNSSDGTVPTDPLAHPESFTSEYVEMITVTFSDKPLH